MAQEMHMEIIYLDLGLQQILRQELPKQLLYLNYNQVMLYNGEVMVLIMDTDMAPVRILISRLTIASLIYQTICSHYCMTQM